MVQRYNASYNDYYENDAGEFVSYEDYVKLEADFKAYKASAYMVAEQYAGVIKELEAELQKYKDQFPDYVECANCRSVTHVEGVEDAMGQSGCRKEDAQECEHVWNRYIVHPHRKICLVCGVKE
ncbi:hypothetical protein [Escherichia phage AV104]|nr:hypothetical protein [Escherichia phage AV104]